LVKVYNITVVFTKVVIVISDSDGADIERIHTAVEFVAFVDTVIYPITTHVCLKTLAIQTLERASTTHYTRQPTTQLLI